MLVSWGSLLAWAADNALLEPLGFQRGFYRVEDDARSGGLALTDQIEPLRLSTWNETLYIEPSAGHQASQRMSLAVRKATSTSARAEV